MIRWVNIVGAQWLCNDMHACLNMVNKNVHMSGVRHNVNSKVQWSITTQLL